MTYFLYRCFDAKNQLIYVGITHDPIARRKQHADSSWWAKWIHRMDVDPSVAFEGKADAEALERPLLPQRSSAPRRPASRSMRPRLH